MSAAHRALARIRAAYGEQAVTRAALREAHLPEASFRWEPIQHAVLPAQTTEIKRQSATMVRRVFPRPKPLPTQRPLEPELGPMLSRGQTIEHLYGPYRVSGGWWKRLVERDYYYAQTDRGDLLCFGSSTTSLGSVGSCMACWIERR